MSNSAENHYDILSPYAPQMPKPLPQMLHLAIKNAPEHMKAAISNSLFPAFGSLMHNVGFRYPDNVFHEPHFMCGLIGPEVNLSRNQNVFRLDLADELLQKVVSHIVDGYWCFSSLLCRCS